MRSLGGIGRTLAALAPWAVCLASFLPAAATRARAAGSPFGPAVARADVDLASCASFQGGARSPAEPDEVLAALGLGGQARAWSAGEARGRGDAAFGYLVALRRPVELGSVWADAQELRLLKDGAPFPGDPGREGDWTKATPYPGQGRPVLFTLPPGTRTRAVLATDSRGWGRSELRVLRLSLARLHNCAPDATANAEAEYTVRPQMAPPHTYAAADPPKGRGHWQSHGPNQEGRIPRAPVSEYAPSWYILSWDEAREVSGLLLRDNFREVKLFRFTGPEGLNPAAAVEGEWERVRGAEEARGPFGERWLSFPAAATRGLRLLVLATEQEQFARIDSVHALVDLGRGPAPEPRDVSKDPPFRIPYALDRACRFTMVVDDAGGVRARNLVARAAREAGKHAQAWDLRDEDGRFVQPGTYRWKAVRNPGIGLRYEMTPYPNVEANAPGNSPWLNGASGPGGWLADHTPPRAVCVEGEDVYLGAPCAESGVAFIRCDLEGRKLSGHHNFAAWTGPSFLAADQSTVYAGAPGDRVWAIDRKTDRVDEFLSLGSTSTRVRGMQGLAARGGELFMSVRASGSWLSNAAGADDVEIEACTPRYPPAKKSNRDDPPDPRRDFLRLFRLTGTPPGIDHGKGYLTWLESTDFAANRNHIVLAFRKPVPVGTLVFPFPGKDDAGGARVRLSVLAPAAEKTWPPDPGREKDWLTFGEGEGKEGFAAVPAPPGTVTRALRITFDKGTDELDRLLEGEGGDDPLGLAGGGDGAGGGIGGKHGTWRGRLEGMKILRRRYGNLFPKARVRVSSGDVNDLGEWDAKRESPLSEAAPGIYLMEWDAEQSVRGLAIKEIDGKRTEIDAWTGAGGGRPTLAGDEGWERVATYEQKLRYYYQPDQDHNSRARYMDGYVDFGRDVKTRAIRLRVVEQWTTKAPDRGGCVGVRRDRGGEKLDPTRCRVYGVAPLGYLGGEPPVDPKIAERIEVYDVRTKKLARELEVESPGRIAFDARGRLHAISGKKIVRLDARGGAPEDLVTDAKAPVAFAFDRAGNAYVFDRDPERMNVRVYDPSGRFVRSIGKAGGRKAGPWDPATFCSHAGVDVDLAVDGRDRLWVVECDYSPKRISLWTSAGEFLRDFLGNTGYGGGGCLDPQDKRRLFCGPMEFELDWETGATRIKGMTWMGDPGFSFAFAGQSTPPEVPIRVEGRTYMVTRPMFAGQQCGVVYLEAGGKLRRVAAVGLANGFAPLRTREILEGLGRKTLADFQFAWTDRNGDQAVQAAEVAFSPKRIGSVSYFDAKLGILGGDVHYEVERFLPGGEPVYRERPSPGSGPGVRLSDGNFVFLGPPLQVRAPDGRTLWTWATEGNGVHAYYSAKPYHDEQMVALFDIVGVGRTRSPKGLGEFAVINTNSGTWHVVTTDGLVAGRIFRDLRDPGRRGWDMREHERGLRLESVTAGQEHFSGYFTTAADGRHYVVAGHNHVSVVEVVGLEDIERMEGSFEVTVDDVRAAEAWARRIREGQVYRRAPVMICRPTEKRIALDGELEDWKDVPATAIEGKGVEFRMTHDGTGTLYLAWEVKGRGPFRNAGNDWRRCFKTGAGVDFQIGTDPAADPGRKDPVAGDLRVLIVLVGGEPIAVSYRPVDPGAPAGAAWETHTMVFRTAFDRVEKLAGARIAHRAAEGSYVVEAALPFESVGLKVRPGLRLKMDWGVLDGGPDGTQTLERVYWANGETQIVSDEAAEARLEPGSWGHVIFAAGSETGGPAGLALPPGDGEGLELELDE